MINLNTCTPNQMLKAYLMASYLYYKEDVSLFQDKDYDLLCSRLLSVWNEVDHPHKVLVTEDDLRAGTGFSIQYPTIVESAARAWYRDIVGEKRFDVSDETLSS